MNIYYMGENINDSKFPIVVWNEQVAPNVGATVLPPEEYEENNSLWGYEGNEPFVIGQDAGALYNNNTDRDRKDTFPKTVIDFVE
ncbi:MAG: hypothetical protein HRU18_06535 [Pseudoalteromonas sp.]|uniref:hypothetical protein n=1 Tax=Pseudoalteromonas sp. TaxID=53249 RepID=UPI001D367D8F|nr:hypothetical protein [Pseudoalteromonas sp.]NRA77846.1 hypothetical protein [Pseudoalteromonas sp.]